MTNRLNTLVAAAAAFVGGLQPTSGGRSPSDHQPAIVIDVLEDIGVADEASALPAGAVAVDVLEEIRVVDDASAVPPGVVAIDVSEPIGVSDTICAGPAAVSHPRAFRRQHHERSG